MAHRLAFFLCVLLILAHSHKAFGQGVEIALEASAAESEVGDLLGVDVVVNARSAALTSVSAFLSFDSRLFELVPVEASSGGVSHPFRSGSFLPGQVYANAVSGDGSSRIQLDYVVITGVGVDGVRPAASGRGVVASFLLKVVGRPEEGEYARIEIDDSGRRRTSYTELERAGAKGRFRYPPGHARVRVVADGSTAAAEGNPEAPQASGESVAGFPPVAEEAAGGTDPPLEAAMIDAGEVPKIRGIGGFRLVTGEEVVLHLDDYVEDPDTPSQQLQWDILADGLVEVGIDAERNLLVRAIPGEFGNGRLVLTVRDPQRNASVTQIEVTVTSREGETEEGSIPAVGEEIVDAPELGEESVDTSEPGEEIVDIPESGEESADTSELGEGIVDTSEPDEEIVDTPESREEVVDISETEEGGVDFEEAGREEVGLSESGDRIEDVDGLTEEEERVEEAGSVVSGEGTGDVREEAVVSETPMALKLGDIPDMELAAGEAHIFSLDDYVEVGDVEGVSWTVSGSPSVAVEIDADRQVWMRGASGFSGHQVLLFTAADGKGNIVTEVVRVEVGVEEVAGATVDPSQVPGVDEEALFELVEPPEFRLLVGALDSALSLDALVAQGDPGAVIWSVRGGAKVQGRIDPGARLLILDARGALPGREVFFLDASLGDRRLSVPLWVNVRAPRLAIRPLPDLVIVAGAVDSSLSLDEYLEGDFAPEQVSWEVQGPEGVEVEVDPRSHRLRVSGSGSFELFLRVVASTGAVETGVLWVEEEIFANPLEPTSTDPGKVPVLHLPQEVVLEPGEVREFEGVVEDVDTELSLLIWEVVAEGGGEAVAHNGSLRVRAVEGVDFRVRLGVADPQGNHVEGELLVRVQAVEPVDATPPQLSLEGRLSGEDRVELRIQTDEELAAVPSLVVGGRELEVDVRDDYYQAFFEVVESGTIEARAAGLDGAGNAGTVGLSLVVGRIGVPGGSVASADGGMRVQAPAGERIVLVHRGEDGYRVDFPAGRSDRVDLIFVHDFSGDYPVVVLRYDSGRAEWEELPTFVSPEIRVVYSSVDGPGLFKLGKGSGAVPLSAEPVVYPNPFNAAATIRYLVEEQGAVRLWIYDLQGQLVRRLVERTQAAGPWTVVWDGRREDGQQTASGVYLFRVETGGGSRGGKMTLLH